MTTPCVTRELRLPLVAFVGWATCLVPCAHATNGEVSFIEGPVNPEDLLALPGTPWIVSSGLPGGVGTHGALYLLNSQNDSWRVFYPNGVSTTPKELHDTRGAPDCPGPVDSDHFQAHGIGLKEGRNGVHTLYVVNHATRESIEIFEVDTRGSAQAGPGIAWIGCVILPEGGVGNAVAALPEGGFVVTVTMDVKYFPGAKTLEDVYPRFADAADARAKTGHVLQWLPDAGWTIVPGTAASGPNGIEISKDGRWLWIANWGGREVVRIARDGSTHPLVIPTEFTPDNLRWGEDGGLWVVGQVGKVKENYLKHMESATWASAFVIGRIDPESGTLTVLPHVDTAPKFGDATVGLQIGKTVWVGTYIGQSIAKFPIF